LTIYVSIAAYRDPQLVHTVQDCLGKARRPEALRFGICWQHGPEESPLPFSGDSRFRVMDIPWQLSRGACWARAEIMRFYDGEDYFLQLDSHHRFVPGWDAVLLDQLGRCESTRPIISTYAPAFDPAHPNSRGEEPTCIEIDSFTEGGVLSLKPGILSRRRRHGRPVRSRFLSAHFLFAPGGFVHDVPYDPDLYFLGEETSLAVRAYTHGYDLFHPTDLVLWHEYSRSYRSHYHWSDHVRSNGVATEWHERDRVSLEKVRRLLEGPWVGDDGCGTRRSLSDYEAYAGISFRTRRVQQYTRRGLEPPNPPACADWPYRMRRWEVLINLDRSMLPAGVGRADFWYVGVHDRSERELCREDLDRAHIDALSASGGAVVQIPLTVEAEERPVSWTVWPYVSEAGWLHQVRGRVEELREWHTMTGGDGPAAAAPR
jgi:hypothetical protein